MKSDIIFSFVLPVYNIEEYLKPCFNSIEKQMFPKENFEVIIIDDCSTDSTKKISQEFGQASACQIQVLSTRENGGPGRARDLGVHTAKGQWLLFVDGDDFISADYLSTLSRILDDRKSKSTTDIISFNWAYNDKDSFIPKCEKKDLIYINTEKNERIHNFLSMKMDGSVIFTAINKQLITNNQITFCNGFHEDVDYIFKVYFHAEEVAYTNKIIYFKNNRNFSIVNTISSKHLDGYLRAWKGVGDYCKSQSCNREWSNYQISFLSGITGAIAVQILKILEFSHNPHEKSELYHYLYDKSKNLFPKFLKAVNLPNSTRYDKITNLFLKEFSEINQSFSQIQTFESNISKILFT